MFVAQFDTIAMSAPHNHNVAHSSFFVFRLLSIDVIVEIISYDIHNFSLNLFLCQSYIKLTKNPFSVLYIKFECKNL